MIKQAKDVLGAAACRHLSGDSVTKVTGYLMGCVERSQKEHGIALRSFDGTYAHRLSYVRLWANEVRLWANEFLGADQQVEGFSAYSFIWQGHEYYVRFEHYYTPRGLARLAARHLETVAAGEGETR